MKSTKQVVVKVEQRHIDKGVIQSDSCPIALALRGYVRPSCSIDVNADGTARISGKITSMPKSARRFVEKFDDSVKVKPFNFRVKLPVSSLK